MKVRWTPTHLRLRITPDELELVRRGEPVNSEIGIGDGRWSIRLEPSGDELGVRWMDGVAVVSLGTNDRIALLDPASEGVYQTRDTGGPRVSVEKDFPCAHPHPTEAGEPVTDRFTPTSSYRERKGLAVNPDADR